MNLHRNDTSEYHCDDTGLLDCRGTILTDIASDGVNYHHCDACGAYVYAGHSSDEMPLGIDRTANEAAWDAGETASPAAAVHVERLAR